MPWDEAKSHGDLLMQRASTTDKAEQNRLAGAEHRAFAREYVAENPLSAPAIALAVPAYQAAKATGLHGSRSDPSVSQAVEGLKGVGEGLVLAATTPWEEAKLEAKRFADSIVKSVPQSVKALFPWQEASQASEKAKQGGSTTPPLILAPEPVKPSVGTLVPTEADMKKLAAFTPAEEAAREAQMTSPAFLSEMKAAIDETKDPAKKKILQDDYDKLVKRKKK